MIRFLKLLVPKGVQKRLISLLKYKQIKDWQRKGCPLPPPDALKQLTVKSYQQKFGYTVLIETGTFTGNMVKAQKENFKKIISIELADSLYQDAELKFKNDKHISILHGDSGEVLHEVMKEINEPAIFWLDGHYSGGITAKGDNECPILDELNAIFKNNRLNHILLIDDARCFTGEGDYPTIAELTKFIKSKNRDYKVEIKHDIICCVVDMT